MDVITSYEPYAQEPSYIEANEALIAALPLDGVTRVLDLACGTGLMSRLLLERAPGLAITGIDLSEESLAIARKDFSAKGLLVEDATALEHAVGSGRGAIRLLHGSATDLGALPGAHFDLCIMGNAIHLMPDKDAFLQGVGRVLRPGARFAFNSVFFTGTFPPGSEAQYREWMMQAVEALNEHNAARVERGERPIGRKRGQVGRAFDKDWRTPEQWAETFERNGFATERVERRSVPISQQGLELVGAYSGLAEVLMSGYPVDVASECLQVGARRMFAKLGISEIGRLWLELTAVRQ